MQRKPVVRNLLTTAGWLCLAACSSTNGNLFDGEVAPPEVETRAVETPVLQPVLEPPAIVVLETGPSRSETSNGDLQLTGEMTVTAAPPVLPPLDPMQPEGPRIVSVSPADGARGVTNDVDIVITFNVPMEQAQTEAAYQSEAVPSSGVSFSWNDDSTVLTITPDAPLDYPTGTDPDDVESRPISFFLSASAQDQDGKHLSAPAEFSFALLRQINVSLSAQQNRDLTGSYRSNDTYGQGDCARNQDTVCVGDNGGNDGIQYKGFMSFDISSLPTSMAQLSSARLNFQITERDGNPFNGLGDLFLDHAAFEAIGAEAFLADPLATVGALAGNGNTGAVLQADVRAALTADIGNRSRSQFRLEFEESNNGNRNADTVISAWDTQRVDVSYLIP
ncbi:MAG: Ig-like domain-containing protein [Deltaproteobacteria bacterium]